MRFKVTTQLAILVVITCGLNACQPNDDRHTEVGTAALPTFAEGELTADIRRTEWGVPYIKADNLESLGFGVAYAYAQDNFCILADQILRFNGERARYLGPDQVTGSGDGAHVVNDFAMRALGIREHAETTYAQLPDDIRALVHGYTAGYNQYLVETGREQLDPVCAGAEWVKPIEPVDVMTYAQGVALLPGANNFLGALYSAQPPQASAAEQAAVQIPEFEGANPTELGSNGWALGGDLTASGRGMLIGNPHFPYTGALRFWRLGIEIPGHLKVVGASAPGMPLVNIGFNEHVAWTHTFSTAARFVVHRLTLDTEDSSGLHYLLDGEAKAFTSKVHQIEVADGQGGTAVIERTSYHSDFGPVIVIPRRLPWGEDSQGNQVAFALHDANIPNHDIMSHWFAMNRAQSIADYRQAFVDYTGTIFNNGIATDSEGDTFLSDGSSVPYFSTEALQQWADSELYQTLTRQAGMFIFPGDSSLYLPNGTIPFAEAPQLQNRTFVQNANDSFWLSNPATPITGVSPLWGRTDNQQSYRTRQGLSMLLAGGSGDEGKFTRSDLVDKLLNNRTYLGDTLLQPLLRQCEEQGVEPVVTDAGSVVIADACAAIAQWDGRMNKDSVGAFMFREFAFEFARNPQWQIPFDASQPVTTPSGAGSRDQLMPLLAAAQERILAAGLDVFARLGEVQFVERSTLTGEPSRERYPWSGAHHVEGGFNVFSSNLRNDGTTFPRHIYPVPQGQYLSPEAGGYHVTFGSSWMYVLEFTDSGPVAEGLLTYSQATDRRSDHYIDQTALYSQQPQLVPIPFSAEEIEKNTTNTLKIKGNRWAESAN